jgi:predicted acetyltransferase
MSLTKDFNFFIQVVEIAANFFQYEGLQRSWKNIQPVVDKFGVPVFVV